MFQATQVKMRSLCWHHSGCFQTNLFNPKKNRNVLINSLDYDRKFTQFTFKITVIFCFLHIFSILLFTSAARDSPLYTEISSSQSTFRIMVPINLSKRCSIKEDYLFIFIINSSGFQSSFEQQQQQRNASLGKDKKIPD